MADEAPPTPSTPSNSSTPTAEKQADKPVELNPQAVEALEKGYHGESAADHGYESRPQDVAEFGKFTDFR